MRPLPTFSLTQVCRLFARGYLGPNSTYGDIYVLKSNVPESIANSLAPSDSCPTYSDNGGGDNLTTWNNLYLPAVTKRINSHIKGNLNLTDSDVTNFPYLCGFETQITGRRSPWCNIFTDDELRKYEYAQDLRYYYGSGESSQLYFDSLQLLIPYRSWIWKELYIDATCSQCYRSTTSRWPQ